MAIIKQPSCNDDFEQQAVRVGQAALSPLSTEVPDELVKEVLDKVLADPLRGSDETSAP